MSTFLYDFSKGKSIDPLQGVTHFYINPYQLPDSWKTLNLGNKIEGLDIDLVVQEQTGLPVIVIPIEVLNLGRCIIKLNEDFSGKIITGKRTIYFNPSETLNHLICINSVI